MRTLKIVGRVLRVLLLGIVVFVGTQLVLAPAPSDKVGGYDEPAGFPFPFSFPGRPPWRPPLGLGQPGGVVEKPDPGRIDNLAFGADLCIAVVVAAVLDELAVRAVRRTRARRTGG